MLGGVGHALGPDSRRRRPRPAGRGTRVKLGGTGKALDLLIYGVLIMIVSVLQPGGLMALLLRGVPPRVITLLLASTASPSASVGVVANRDISFEVAPGELVGVIGPNGAGKSTLFDVITGFQRPTPVTSGSTASPSRGCGPTRSAASAWLARSRSSSHSPA